MGIAAGGAAGLTVLAWKPTSHLLLTPVEAQSAPSQAPVSQNFYTACHQCDQQCAEVASVWNGILTKLDGNYNDQKSKGRLCPKGQSGVMELYNPYRIKGPLIRTNTAKGFNEDPKWRSASWDEALDLVATNLQNAISTYGPQSVAGDDVSYVGSFFSAIGSPNTFECGNTCYFNYAMEAAVLGGIYENADLIGGVTKYVITWSNTGESVENPFGGQIAAAKGGGAKIVSFDPRLSKTAAKADEWIPINPGTDLAAMLAMINVIVTGGLYDHDFVEKYTSGYDQLSSFIGQYTPEWAAPITDVPADTLRRIATEFATTLPSVATIRRGPAKQRKNYFRVIHAWAILNALVGAIDVRGGTIADRSPNLAYPPPPKSPPAPYGQCIDGREKLLPTPGKVWDGTIMSAGLQDVFADGVLNGPYPVKVLIFAKANPFTRSPNVAKWVQALQQTFTVVIDYQMSDTAYFADVVLPCPTYLERDEIVAGALYSPVPQVYCRQQVVTPLYDTKTEDEIWQELGTRLGVSDYLPPIGPAALDATLKPMGITFEQLTSQGIVYADQPFSQTTSFGTPSGKIELFSQRMADAGFDGLPSWQGPYVEPTSDYPYYFVTWNDSMKYMSRHNWNPLLEELMDSSLWINTSTAKSLGIRDGDTVNVESPYGSLQITAKVVEGIRSDTVGMAHGRGVRNPQADPYALIGSNDNQISRPATISDHLQWYADKEEPFGISRITDFTVNVSKAT